MPGSDPFDLPTDVVDVAMARLVGTDGDAQRRALATLLEQFPHHGPALHALAATLAGADRMLSRTFAASTVDAPPDIDGYRVVRKLGEGAFGIVYLCEQDEPIRRLVAIKLLRPGAGDRGTLARFDAERSFLARLHHPMIAQIHDAGLLADGRPWFVMEHVPGAPITAYCDAARLPIERRLALFARLCQGVQHAHEQGIVHRDLKPANILVVDIDGEAQPKIIDFGIARALERPAERGEARTETGRVVGTPGYMSPEQMAGDLAAIDARTDLFSLGVVLYELLTGELPWGKRPTDTDSEPPRPSSRIGTDAKATPAVAERRASQPRRLAARLRGELDWIVLKALSRAPADRYASALELAADIHRHLRGEPVLAGPPSRRYRLRKFVRRHRTGLASLAAIGSLLVVGAWLLGGYRAEVRSRTDDAEAAVQILLARANDPELVGTPGAEPVRQALARDALTFYERFLQARPDDLRSREGRARTLWTLAQVHWRLGQFARSEQVARDAVACSESLLATRPDDPNFLRILANAERALGRSLHPQNHHAEARSCFQRAVDHLERSHAQAPRPTAGLYVLALIELESTLEDGTDLATRAALLQRASALQAELLREQPDSFDERDSYVLIEARRGLLTARQGDHEAAAALLANAEATAAAGAIHESTRHSWQMAAAELAFAEGRHEDSLAHLARGALACREWIAKTPHQAQPYAMLGPTLCSIGQLRAMDEPGSVVAQCYADAAEVAEAWMQNVPGDPRGRSSYVQAVYKMNRHRLTSGRRADLAAAEAPARRADRLLATLSENELAVEPHLAWTSLGTFGLVADALDLADADAVWAATESAIAAWRERHALAGDSLTEFTLYTLRASQRHLVAGRIERSRALLDDLEAAITGAGAVPELSTHTPELWRQRAHLAAIQQDWLAAESAIERARAADPTWRGVVSAAAAAYGVWLAAKTAGADEAFDHRDRTIELAATAIAQIERMQPRTVDDPWLLAPLAQTRLRLWLARHDRGDAVDAAELADTLTTLAAMRETLHANLWDEDLYRAGRRVQER